MTATASTYVHYTFAKALNMMLHFMSNVNVNCIRTRHAVRVSPPGPGCASKRTQGLPCRHVI